jgi:hypothetical protein
MKPNVIRFKNNGLVILSALLLSASFTATAQKSVYDVIPGSGPKRPANRSLPGVVIVHGRNEERRDHYPVYNGRRRNLPPGQAKKIYGGSATDYAPGQLKKRRSHEDDRWEREDNNEKHGKHNKHEDD